MIRPLLTAVIEYLLMILVLKYGTKHKTIIAAVLFFLATYQLGEVVIFLSGGNEIGFKLAYVATTMLPPLGILLAEKILKKKLGYAVFQLIAIFFAIIIFILPKVALDFEFGPYCIRINEYSPILSNYWSLFYQGTLMFTMAALLWGLWRGKTDQIRVQSRKMLIAYLSFDGLAFFIAYLEPWFGPSMASLMCALALIAAFIFTDIALNGNWKTLRQKAQIWRWK